MRQATLEKLKNVNALIEKGEPIKVALKKYGMAPDTYYKAVKKAKKPTRRYTKKPQRMQVTQIAPVSMGSDKTMVIITSDMALINNMISTYKG